MNDMSNLRITHCDIEVFYKYDTNEWEFSFGGRDRLAPSLAKAKETIDVLLKSAKKDAFSPVKAIYMSYSQCQPGTITSIASSESFSGDVEVWFTDEAKKRSKESARSMYEHSESNLRLIKEAKELENEADRLRKEAKKKLSSMTKLKLTIPE